MHDRTEGSTSPLLSPTQLAAYLGVGRTTVYDWMTAGKVPPPFYLSRKSPRWRRSTVDAWIAEREAEAIAAAGDDD
ncbi:MAG TPA: helix-turn-helix domain-containing protein [Polyangiaceae bacterium LLY-WYZ-14_1]|nr:helix-turn-helix domain-containing protein [Polyangiaceae bacterium LLY-WYZ-14_1]